MFHVQALRMRIPDLNASFIYTLLTKYAKLNITSTIHKYSNATYLIGGYLPVHQGTFPNVRTQKTYWQLLATALI